MIWKRSIPVFRHRAVTLEYKLNNKNPRARELHSSSVSFPAHLATNIMLACKEARDVMHELYFPKADILESVSTVSEHFQTAASVSFAKGSLTSLSRQRINYDDDIFYFSNGLHSLSDLGTIELIVHASIKTIMIPMLDFNDMIQKNSHHYYVIALQMLPGLKSIIILDFIHHKLYRSLSPPQPTRGYGSDYLNFVFWLEVESPGSFEPFDKNAINTCYSRGFQDWVDREMKHFLKPKDIRIYYADTLDCRVGPHLTIKNDECYEFSGGNWISTTTGLEAKGDQ
ncbi:hypothetical protein BKA65DRAFT_511544 [Rhexocercosporidium sp. MPI-PUGE-AT-0058]|nr:hypothetical protein BKA65DRAFT_511544 [Rhexocercosporidium sp. MPI-PUGE-AT-0058]